MALCACFCLSFRHDRASDGIEPFWGSVVCQILSPCGILFLFTTVPPTYLWKYALLFALQRCSRQQQIIKERFQVIETARHCSTSCNIAVLDSSLQLVFRKYSDMWFIVTIDEAENVLATYDLIHCFAQSLSSEFADIATISSSRNAATVWCPDCDLFVDMYKSEWVHAAGASDIEWNDCWWVCYRNQSLSSDLVAKRSWEIGEFYKILTLPILNFHQDCLAVERQASGFFNRLPWN